MIDPSLRLDAIRDVAIAGGRIAAVEADIAADAADTHRCPRQDRRSWPARHPLPRRPHQRRRGALSRGRCHGLHRRGIAGRRSHPRHDRHRQSGAAALPRPDQHRPRRHPAGRRHHGPQPRGCRRGARRHREEPRRDRRHQGAALTGRRRQTTTRSCGARKKPSPPSICP